MAHPDTPKLSLKDIAWIASFGLEWDIDDSTVIDTVGFIVGCLLVQGGYVESMETDAIIDALELRHNPTQSEVLGYLEWEFGDVKITAKPDGWLE